MKPRRMFIEQGSPLPAFLEPVYSPLGLEGYVLGFIPGKNGTVVLVGW